MYNQEIPSLLRTAIWRGYDKCCFYCGVHIEYPDLEIDHFIPKSISEASLKKLKDDGFLASDYDVFADYNLVASCKKDNRQKGNNILPSYSLPNYAKKMEAGSARIKDLLTKERDKGTLGKILIIAGRLSQEGLYSKSEIAQAILEYNRSEPSIEFLGVTLPLNTTRISVSPSVEEYFSNGTIKYYDIFKAVLNPSPRTVVYARGGNYVLRLSDDDRLRYTVEDGVINLLEYHRLRD